MNPNFRHPGSALARPVGRNKVQYKQARSFYMTASEMELRPFGNAAG
jgi:hypothetical protein